MGGYFIGTLLIHENTKEKTPFAVRTLPFIETQEIPEGSILKIVLDGQQRIASLIYALTAPNTPIKASNKYKYPHRFFLDIEKFFKTKSLSESLLTVSMLPKNSKKILPYEYLIQYNQGKISVNDIKYIDLSILAKEQEKPGILDDLYDDLREALGKEKAKEIRALLREVLNYELIYIKIPQESTIDEIVEIFERINKTSYKLSSVDLLFAKLYKEKNSDIRKVILENLSSIKEEYSELAEIFNEITLIKVIALLSNKEIKPSSIIKLSANDIDEWLDKAIDGFKESLKFLYKSAGVRKKWIPYTSLIIPLAAMFALLKKETETKPFNSTIKIYLEKISYNFIKLWYWSNTLSERYDEGVTSKSFYDFRLYKSFLEEILLTLEKKSSLKEGISLVPKQVINKLPLIELNKFKEPRNKNSALLKALYNLLILNNVLDFETGKPFDKDFTDEHIFPKSFVEEKKANKVLNRTLSAPETNKYLKNLRTPQKYFTQLEEKYLNHKGLLNQILSSHFINEKAFKYLKQNDFESFLNERLSSIKNFLKEKLLIPEELIKD